MPELITHYLIGEKSAQKVKNDDLKKILNANKKEYILGCQGGDLFFFYNYGNLKSDVGIPSFGNRLHTENIQAFFEHSLEYIKENKDDSLIAYYLGYLCHYAADKQIHPFVYKKSKDETTAHHNIEFMMGKQLLLDITGENTNDFDMKEVFDFELPNSIINYYIYIGEKIYNQKLSKAIILKAKADFSDFKICTQNPDIKYKFLSKIFKPFLGYDPMALVYKNENNWEYFNRTEYADFVSDVLEAIAYSKNVMECAFDCIYKKDSTSYCACFDGTDFRGIKQS